MGVADVVPLLAACPFDDDHCDVLSINAFEIPARSIKGLRLLGKPGIYDRWASWTGAYVPDPGREAEEDFLFFDVKAIENSTDMPILLSSFSYRAEVPGLNDFPPEQIFAVLNNQQERAGHYENYVNQALLLPSVVGVHWFLYSDQPAEGRWDGENSNFGLVDIDDNPYSPLIERMATANSREIQNRWAVVGQSSMSHPTGRYSYHAARQLRALWGKHDPRTDARIWAAKALQNPELFATRTHGEPQNGELNQLGIVLKTKLEHAKAIKADFLIRAQNHPTYYKEHMSILRSELGR